SPVHVLLGLSFHGFAFTWTAVVAQMYLAERVEAAWRTRAQALLGLMTGGVGSLAGYLACGAWLTSCSYAGRTDWPKYWAGLSLPMAAILMFFLLTYRGKRQ
ncbi:MAG: hypothetical protein FJ405_18665, partial [Verrucomicrobia bacterium]|nr:hypothetical protein [Verrucomicrobiota bacterium]